MKKTLITITYSFVLLSFVPPNVCMATPIEWSVNGHYYDAVSFPQGITWNDAAVYAAGLVYQGFSGHLATISSATENDFIIANLGGPFTLDGYWLGGFQPTGSPEPAGNWQWITGEPWLFTNWYSVEPTNRYAGDTGFPPHPELAGASEEVLQFGYNNGQWNDMAQAVAWDGLIVEYQVPEPATLLILGLGGLILRRKK